MMQRTGLLAVLLLTTLLFLAASFIPDESVGPQHNTPWDITLSTTGNSQLFGITLGESLLDDAQRQWKEAAEITLFLTEGAPSKVEAYFQQVTVGGLRASIVAEIQVNEKEMTTLINQGARISTQGDGSRKITLSDEGVEGVEQSVVNSLTYLPKSNLSKEIIQRRFGLPNQVFIMENGVEHWVYPQWGLDISISEQEKEVLQYVPPSQFERLLAPLLKTQQAPTT